MQLDDYQYMGQHKPYDDETDSSLNESDDEQIVDVMSDEKFRQQVRGLIKQTLSGEYTMDAASITIQQIKHGFSKNIEACLSAILPSILNELSSQMTTDMKNAQKLKILQDRLPEYKDMINNFMTDVEDETHVIYLVTLCCS